MTQPTDQNPGRSVRWQLPVGEDTVDRATWAGSVLQVNGVAPRVRVGATGGRGGCRRVCTPTKLVGVLAIKMVTALQHGGFTGYRLRINGPVDRPVDLTQLLALPHQDQITQHFCIQGWSGVAKLGRGVHADLPRGDWTTTGSEMDGVLLPRRQPGLRHPLRRPPHRPDEQPPHDARLRHERRPGHVRAPAPLRLRNEVQLGFKRVTWIKGIEFLAHFSEIGGGYNEDHEFFGYRQTIWTSLPIDRTVT